MVPEDSGRPAGPGVTSERYRDPPDARVAALAASSRRRLHEVLRSAARPLDAQRLAAAVDLHVTTTRHHLGTLERAGLVRRELDRSGRPGRPRVLYAAGPDPAPADGYRVLTELLAAELGRDPDTGRRSAERAGERWAAAHVAPGSDASAEDALNVLESLFDRIGFSPRRADRGQQHRFLLEGCPFRDVARAHPEVVCTVHLGLLTGALDRLGAPPADARLRPFEQPELCIVDVSFRTAGSDVLV